MGHLGSSQVGAIGGSGAAAAEAATTSGGNPERAKGFFPRFPMCFSDFPSEHAIMP